MSRTTHDLPAAPPAAPARFDADRVRALVEPLVTARGFGLWDIEWTGGVLRVFIEHPAQIDDPLAGVTLDDCVYVSRAISAALDEVDVIPGAYHLEVSSPGLDRPLRTANDFKRQVGRLAKCKLKEPAPDGQMALRGTVLAASDDAVAMEVDGKHFDVPLANIRDAKLVFELGEGKSSSQGKTKKKKGAKPSNPKTNGPRPSRK
ncbi:MAG: ribosome maturation factor RimP [Deltaproteobacteria bacterium]|nr:ribosome maturation factor RimP [Deltaproteobacteria bacterium]